MRILIADDDPVTLHALGRILEKWQHDVTSAPDGRTAWERFRDGRPEVVITDWVMPELSGLELIRKIRHVDAPDDYVYCVLLTSRTETVDVVRGMEAGADDYLRKPFDREELGARLRAGERILQLQHSLAAQNLALQGANEEITAANQRMREDLEAAARMQQAMLPTTLPEFEDLEFAWRFEPCEELAGDILNVFRLDERHVGFYLLDVSGHGVRAALTSVSLSRAMLPLPDQPTLLMRPREPGAPPTPVPPGKVARQLNLRYATRSTRGQFFTLLYGVLEVPARRLTYVSAGHPGAFLLRTGTAPQRLDATGPPVGIRKGLDFGERTLDLVPGDRLVVYSDGLQEARDEMGEQFGVDRLLDHLLADRHRPLEESVSRLVAAVMDWRPAAGLADDASCLAVEVGGKK